MDTVHQVKSYNLLKHRKCGPAHDTLCPSGFAIRIAIFLFQALFAYLKTGVILEMLDHLAGFVCLGVKHTVT